MFNQEAIAKEVLARSGITGPITQQPPSPQSIGKRNAEDVVYGATIVVWLAFPLFLLKSL